MNITIDTVDFHDETLTGDSRADCITNTVKRMTNELLEIGMEEHEISYIYAYIATDLGLRVSNNSFRVLMVVLEGVYYATVAANDCLKKKQQDQAVRHQAAGNVIDISDSKVVH